MIGLFLALLYAGIMSIKGLTGLVILSHSANFLFWWHLIWSIIYLIPISFLLFILTMGTTVAGVGAGYDAGKGGALVGGIVGLLLGGSLSLLAIVRFAIKRTLLVLGSYLIVKSVSFSSSVIGNGELDKQNLIIGLILLFTGFVILKPKTSTSRTTTVTTSN